MNISEFVWRRLSEWGLRRVYGYPGDGVGGLDVALEKAWDTMEYVQVRHEEMAAFMASAHAKFTGQVGLCYATSGPGSDPSAERAVRRQDGSCPCCRVGWPAGEGAGSVQATSRKSTFKIMTLLNTSDRRAYPNKFAT
jgi:hypothetical protein